VRGGKGAIRKAGFIYFFAARVLFIVISFLIFLCAGVAKGSQKGSREDPDAAGMAIGNGMAAGRRGLCPPGLGLLCLCSK